MIKKKRQKQQGSSSNKKVGLSHSGWVVLLLVTLLSMTNLSKGIQRVGMALKSTFWAAGWANANANANATTTSSNTENNSTMIINTINPLQESAYAWIGNQWVPPDGIPMYSPRAIHQTFSKLNVLWVGDSTSRQDWATAWAMLLAAGNNQSAITEADLNKEININKSKRTEWCARNTTLYQVMNFDTGGLCRRVPTNSSSSKFDGSSKFDLLSSQTCWHGINVLGALENPNYNHNESGTMDIGTIASTITDGALLSDQYDVMVLGIGVWENFRNWDCRKANSTNEERLHSALDSMQHTASSHFRVIWKTSGSSARGSNDEQVRSEGFNDFIRTWFATNQPAHMYLLDWSRAVTPRSSGKDRIAGDLAPHWGLQARTLLAQMLTHRLRLILAA